MTMTNNFTIIVFFILLLSSSLQVFPTIAAASSTSSSISSSIINIASTDSSNRNRSSSDYVIPYQGVNVLGYYTTMPELRNHSKLIVPKAYYEESFKIISQAGMNIIRYLFTWESYERNPALFTKELTEVAKAADKSGIKVVYANDHYHLSSWLDTAKGYGFPSFLFKNDIVNFPLGGGGASDSPAAQVWWTNWYNRAITVKQLDRTIDGWTLQAEFLKKIVRTVDHHKSTLGYEILNEPIIYSLDQWEKLGNYNTFIANALREVTNKIIVFDRQLPSGVGGSVDAVPQNMIKMSPKNIKNLVLKTTLFGLPTHCSSAEARLNTAARTAQILGIPLWVGEFNVGISSEAPIAAINQTAVNLFIEKFKEMKAWGWSFWLWSFRQHSSTATNYNLANITKEKSIVATKYFDYLKNAISASDDGTSDNNNKKSSGQILDKAAGSNNTDTICPTAAITQINGTELNADYSSSSPIEPVLVHVGSRCLPDTKILVQGEAYDVGSGIKSVKIHLDRSPLEWTPQQSKGDWSNWSVLLPINNNDDGNNNARTFTNASCEAIHRLIIIVTDNAGNVDFTTVFISPVMS
jgi:Cellulase (glycosyl hydrolase family 5)